MATFGIYQVLDPLYVTPRGSVNSAKIVGGDPAGRIAVKIFNPPKPDPDEPNWEPKYFLDRAQVQRRVAASGGAHWAPVYSLGFTPDGGAYYVTDYHALTAQKMIDGRVPIDARALHAIVRSVLGGLEEIRRLAGRAHANLKPSNVLLVGKGPADELRAVLADPGQEYKAQQDGEAGDLRGVGLLIHELVLNRPPINGETPKATDAGWEKLGDKAEAWRELCAQLLAHPIATRVATLPAAIKAVDALAPSRLKVPHLRLHGKPKHAGVEPVHVPPKIRVRRAKTPRAPSKLKRRVVQVAALLLLVGGALGIVSMLEAREREELCTARNGWFGSLAIALKDPARRERFAADPHLRHVADGVADVENAGVTCTGGRPQALGFIDYFKTRRAVAALHQVEQDLAPESWPKIAPMRELAKTYEQRGWQQPAQFVKQLLEGVRPTPAVSTAMSRPSTPEAVASLSDSAGLPLSPTLAQRIERVLRLQPIIEQQSAAADSDWKQLDERATALEASPDSIVHGFGVLLRREAVSAMKLTDDGLEGLPQLKQSAGLAMQVLDALRTGPPGTVDTVRFAKEVVAPMRPNDLEPADLRRWLLQRPQYVVRKDDITAAADKLQRLYNTTANDVAKSAPEPNEQPAFQQEQNDVEGAIRELRQSKFIERDVAEGKLTQRVAQIESQIGGLKRYYHAEDANDWLANLVPYVASSERLKSRWNAWVTTLKSDAKGMSEDRRLFTQYKTRTDRLRDVLTDLEVMIPQPPDGLTEAFAKVARRRREDRLDELLKLVDVADPSLKPEQIKQAGDALTAWYADLKALNQDFPISKRILTLDDRPDERWRAKETFWTDPAIQALIRADIDRIEHLQKLRNAPRAKLASETSAEGVRPEVVIAAWQLLGEDVISPPWPDTKAELETEAALRARVLAESETMDTMGAQRKSLEAALAREGPRRWRRYVERVNSEKMLVAALQLQEPFRVYGPELAEMSPKARFNTWLCIANLAVHDNNSKGLNDVVLVNLRIAAEQLRAGEMLEKLDRLKLAEPFAGAQLGNVFPLTVKGLDEPIEFRRVEPTADDDTGARPFYLGTREVTFGQFVGMIEGAGRWDEARKLAWPYRPGKGDGRRGARVWEWNADATSPRLALTQLWMTPDDINRHNDFPADFHPEAKFNRNVISPKLGGMPSDRHPMQYISAQGALYYAASLGVRLPTSAEWHAALAASGKTVDRGNWNLRDSRWEAFRAHAAKAGIAPEHWPDRGAFPGDPSGPITPAASRKGQPDDAVLFRPEPSNDGTFADLVGNVAEYVCEVPDAFARHEKENAEDVKNFLADTPDAIAVIGGSALSPPETPVDEPLRVTRPDRAFSDVGLRLAFTAPSRSLAERLKYVLAGEEYRWPRTASANTGTR